ncbi:hypothetical protein ABZW96_00835 [Nocardia sp. NPDC004168]|uniref:hypothetical protein n=1 Tax=Nocardia sp. NPDC004168 TaxID=3154452 RepID=UPI0033A08F5F
MGEFVRTGRRPAERAAGNGERVVVLVIADRRRKRSIGEPKKVATGLLWASARRMEPLTAEMQTQSCVLASVRA